MAEYELGWWTDRLSKLPVPPVVVFALGLFLVLIGIVVLSHSETVKDWIRLG